jgi:hypothetical protein
MKLFWAMVIAIMATGWMASVSAQVMLPERNTGAVLTVSDPATPEAAREMVARLSDSEVRALLLHRLDGVAESVTLAVQRLPDL